MAEGVGFEPTANQTCFGLDPLLRSHGRGIGVGRGLAGGVLLGVSVGLGVAVAVGVGVCV
jgi:hypothetical protein